MQCLTKTQPFPLILAAAVLIFVAEGCGNPHNPDIVYKKLTMEEFEKLPPEEQETPEVQENMGDKWRDPNDPKTAPNPKRRLRIVPKKA
jgi:hypothetical protein